MSSKPQVINNQFYGTNIDDDNSLFDDTKFQVSNEAVRVTSPAYSEKVSSSYYPTEATFELTQHVTASHIPSYSTELPTRIYASTASTSSEESDELSNSDQFSKIPYDHSDIAYSPSDAELLIEDSNNLVSHYPMSTAEPQHTETRTEAPIKNKFSKPIFKLKPTQQHTASTEKYVLVHTISHDKQSEGNHENPTKKPSTNESIQSIILMLNGSNPGPEYDVDSANVNSNYHSGSGTTPSYGSTSMIDRDKYGSSSYYITTKLPVSPGVSSTSSSGYTPYPTRRKSPTRTTTTKTVSKVKVTATRAPQTATTLNVPSTSYVYSPKPIRSRPTTTAPSSTTAIRKTTTVVKKGTANDTIKKATTRPSIIVKRPTADVENNYVVISGGGITKHPSPTVHITPKPIINILASSTLDQVNNKQTKRPQSEASPTPSTARPPFVSTTPATFISSSIYVPAIQDFHNEGYFVVTHRPASGVSSTAVYSISSGVLNSHPPTAEHDPVNFSDEAPVMNNDDFSNFPPVRNPNLNMTAANNVMDESDISTPSFVEDEQLSSKIDLLVNKLVASMQGNLDNLVDIVYERKNISVAEQDIVNLHKNGTILQDSKPTAKPSKPAKVPSSKPPPRVTSTTGRPTSQAAQSKKPPTKTTTKKTTVSTKKPANKPASPRPPSRITTTPTTKKPVRKVTTTTTERAPEDEIIEEEGEGEDVGEETDDENNVVNNIIEVDDATPAPLENGRIRKQRFLGLFPN